MDIVIATHGNFAEGLVDAAKLILGSDTELKYVSLQKNDNIDDFEESFKQTLEACEGKPLVFVDMFGGSPFNISMKYSKQYDYSVITGVNLPMVIESALSKEFAEDYDDFVNDLVDKSKDTIQKVKL